LSVFFDDLIVFLVDLLFDFDFDLLDLWLLFLDDFSVFFETTVFAYPIAQHPFLSAYPT
jgi:hypothetical protein